MIALLYYGQNPERVRKAWLIAVLDRIRFKSVTKKRGIWIFELDCDTAKNGLSLLQVIDFIKILGDEVEYVSFCSY